MKTYEIAVVHGDGIGPEVCQAAIDVLKATSLSNALNFVEYQAGANQYLKSGTAFPDETYHGCKKADAILHGAAGLPGVTYPDGTETGIEFGLQLRFRLDLFANVRPIKLRPGITSCLRGRKAGDIDYVILRENTEGLYAARGNGVILRDEVAVDSLVVTRKGNRAHLPGRLRARPQAQRRSPRRQEAGDRLRQGQCPSDLRVLPEESSTRWRTNIPTSSVTMPTPTR